MVAPLTSLSLSLLTYKIGGSLPFLPCEESARTKTVETGESYEGHCFSVQAQS